MTPAGPHDIPRTLAGAAILQVIPALRDDLTGHTAIDIALMLLQSGARALIAGEGGPLVGELRAFGGEWIDMVTERRNPLALRRNARRLSDIIAGERIDIVHAHSPGAAWSAVKAVTQMPVKLVTSFSDRIEPPSLFGAKQRAALVRGDRVLAPSSFVSRAMIERYRIASDRITVIPRSIDTAVFSPAAVNAERIAEMRRVWGILPHYRVVLTPGRLATWNGQIAVVDAARLLVGNGARDVAFVFVGNDRVDRRYRNTIAQRARVHGIETMVRIVGHVPDMPTAIAAADVVAVTPLKPPLSGRAASEAQAMGRPVVVNAIGALPENVLTPPRMPEHLRTGWVVRPGQAGELARAIAGALALDQTAYEALGARARQFAEFMFSPQSVAEAIRNVYTSLLTRT